MSEIKDKYAQKGTNPKHAGRKPSAITVLKRLALEEAGEEAEKSLAVVIKIRNTAKSEKIKMAAAVEIMDRVWGKSTQKNEHTGKDGKPLIPIELFEAALNKAYGPS
jgi:hypothetical protein